MVRLENVPKPVLPGIRGGGHLQPDGPLKSFMMFVRISGHAQGIISGAVRQAALVRAHGSTHMEPRLGRPIKEQLDRVMAEHFRSDVASKQRPPMQGTCL